MSTAEETYLSCQRCKRQYPQPSTSLICRVCETRCPICNALNRCCQNPTAESMAARYSAYRVLMEKHRKAGDELWWFERFEATIKTGKMKAKYWVWCTLHKPNRAELIQDQDRSACSIVEAEATCDEPGCTSRAIWES